MSLFLLSMLWAILLLISTLWLIHRGWKKSVPGHPILILVVLALFVRLLPGLVLVQASNYDIQSFDLVSTHVLAGDDIFISADTENRHPYLPFTMYWLAMAKWMSIHWNLAFTNIVKLLPIIADAAISVVIFRMLNKIIPPDRAFYGGLIYAINPISVMVSSYHGQFDSLAMLLLLVSVWQANRSPYISGWWLGLSVLAKSWPVLALPQLVFSFNNIKQRIGLLFMFGVMPVLGVLLFMAIVHAPLLEVIIPALSYNHGLGAYGFTYPFHLFMIIWPNWGTPLFSFIYTYSRYLILTALILLWIFIARRQPLISGILTLFIGFFAFTHAFAIQYLLWLVPLAILNQEYKWLYLYILASFSYLFLTYNTVILHQTITNLMPYTLANLALIIPASLPIWFISIAWLIQRVRNVRNNVYRPEKIEVAAA